MSEIGKCTTKHQGLRAWVEEMKQLCEPAAVHWCDGSQEEYDRLCEELVEAGTFTRQAARTERRNPGVADGHVDRAVVAAVIATVITAVVGGASTGNRNRQAFKTAFAQGSDRARSAGGRIDLHHLAAQRPTQVVASVGDRNLFTGASFVLAVNAIALLAAWHSLPTLKQHASALSLYLIMVMGINGVIMTRDLFNLFIFIEITSLATYALIGMERTGTVLAAGFKYIIATSVATAFFLLGTIFIYYQVGTLNIDDIIAHELLHQWFGDLVTCKNWEHLWLQEGWATFGEALWDEEKARFRVGENAWHKLPRVFPTRNGISYLHLQSAASKADPFGVLFESVAAAAARRRQRRSICSERTWFSRS